jgi:hypothetical protein
MLTLAQALAIKTNSSTGPWRASQLVGPSTPKPAHLLPLVTAVGEQRILMFGKVRPLSVLLTNKTWADLTNAFNGPPPSAADFKACLNTLSKALPQGSSIVYVSTDGQTVGISGKINAVRKLKAETLTKDQADAQVKGWEDTGEGLGGVVASGGLLLAVSSSGFIVILAFIGFAAAGALLGVGINNLVDGYCPAVSSTPASSSASEPGGPVLGDPPSLGANLTNQDIENLYLQLEYLDMVTIPDPGALPGAGDLTNGDGDGDGGSAAA